MSSSDSQSDYSSDSDFNDDEDEVQNQSSRHPSISSQKRNIQIGGRNYVQIQELLQLCSDHHHPYNSSKKDENSIPHNYQLGEKNWKDLWIPSMVALGMSYYNYKDNSKKSASDVLKNSDKLVKKSHLLSTSSFSSTTIPSSNNVDSNTPSILTQQKQKYILSMLNKMESQLEDYDPLLAHNFTENTSNIIPTPQSTTSESSSCHNTSTPATSTNIKVSSNIQYAFENKIKYGHVRAVLEQATAVIRKISKEIKKFKEKDRKLFIESQIQRGQVELLGPTAFRERIHKDLSLLLTPQEVTLVMKKFDLNGMGHVNIADVYGNALLVSSSKKKPPPSRLLPINPPINMSKESPHQLVVRKSTGYRAQRIGSKKLPPMTNSSSPPSASIQGSLKSEKTITSIDKEAEREMYKRCIYQLASISDEAIYLRLTHTGFTTHIIDYLRPYLILPSSRKSSPNHSPKRPNSQPPSSSLNSAPQGTSEDLEQGTGTRSTSGPSSIGHPPSSQYIISSLEFNFLLKEFGLEWTTQEKKIVTKRCHENFRGSNFNEVNLVKLFHDRMKMKKKMIEVEAGARAGTGTGSRAAQGEDEVKEHNHQ